MKSEYLSWIAGILMIGVFAINAYIGLEDVNIHAYNLVHFYLNWIMAGVDLIAAAFLFIKSKDAFWIVFSGVAWPLAFLLSLAGDVMTNMCLGTPSDTNCWPSTYDAFRYLILGDPSEGWMLWQYTIPTVIVLLVIIIILSTFSIRHIGTKRNKISESSGPAVTQEENRSVLGMTVEGWGIVAGFLIAKMNPRKSQLHLLMPCQKVCKVFSGNPH